LELKNLYKNTEKRYNKQGNLDIELSYVIPQKIRLKKRENP